MTRKEWKYPDATHAEKVTEAYTDEYGRRAVMASTLVPIESADDDCRNPCGHVGVWDERGWMYDARWCAVCGAGLGFL